MKKISAIIAVVCVTALAFALTGCGESKQPETTKTEETTAAPETTVEETKAEETTAAETTAAEETKAEETTAAEETKAEETTAAEETKAEAAGGELTPTIVIEAGDYDGVEALGKDAQNFKVEEGTVAKITGEIRTPASTSSIGTTNADGKFIGINMILDGDWEKPADGTEAEVTGTFKKGSFNMEFHVAPENIVLK